VGGGAKGGVRGWGKGAVLLKKEEDQKILNADCSRMRNEMLRKNLTSGKEANMRRNDIRVITKESKGEGVRK